MTHADTPRDNAQPVQIVGVGLATLDVLMRVGEMPTFARGGRMQDFALEGGGMVGTAMVAAAKLGARAGYVGTIGSGYAGLVKRASLAEPGVDLRRARTLEAPERQVVAVYVEADTGERHFSGLAGFAQELDPLDPADRAYLTAADYLLLDGFHYDAALTAARWMRQAGKTVVYDGSKTAGPIGERTRVLLEHVDVLICGEGFAPALTGQADPAAAGRAALAAGPRVVVQTLGAAGCLTSTADDAFATPAFEVEVVDTTGAGDVFHGAYLVGLLHGWDLRRVARFASAVAAIKCTRLSGRAGIPSFAETLAFLAARGAAVE